MTEPSVFDELFRSAKHSAVHLEMRDDYGPASPAFMAQQAGRPYDRSGADAAWHALIGSFIGRGGAVRRARIISEPVSAYIRYEYEATPAANLPAGEEVRWLPRRKASDLALPGNDFWLFDGSSVIFNHFGGEGAPAGKELCSDPAVVRLCASAFEAVWARAIPHEEYRPV